MRLDSSEALATEPAVATPASSPTPAFVSTPFAGGPPPYIEPPSIQTAVVQPTPTPAAASIAASPQATSPSNAPSGFFYFLRQLFDFRVVKYLTLYIVRLYWILALFVVALFLVGIVLSLVLEGPHAAFRAPTSEDSLLQMLGQPRPSTSEYANVLAAYDRFKWFSLKVIFGVSSILMVRVSCEMLVVAFNIANSLKSIDRKIDALDRKE